MSGEIDGVSVQSADCHASAGAERQRHGNLPKKSSSWLVAPDHDNSIALQRSYDAVGQNFDVNSSFSSIVSGSSYGSSSSSAPPRALPTAALSAAPTPSQAPAPALPPQSRCDLVLTELKKLLFADIQMKKKHSGQLWKLLSAQQDWVVEAVNQCVNGASVDADLATLTEDALVLLYMLLD